MQQLWKTFPRQFEQKVNGLLDHAEPSTTKAFQLYKTCQQEKLCSFTFEEFGPPAQDHEAMRRYRLRKGPDFQSRLDAYYNVLGPNRRTLPAANADRSAPREPDHDDVCHPLRRAILIRAQLRCGTNERLDFDPDVVDALLAVAAYKHGARSLEKVVAAMRPAGGGPIRRSALPPPQVTRAT